MSICDFDDLSKPVFVKNLEKAQEINPIFSPDGHKLLILTQTYTDESGKSYYGETSLYYYDVNYLLYFIIIFVITLSISSRLLIILLNLFINLLDGVKTIKKSANL